MYRRTRVTGTHLSVSDLTDKKFRKVQILGDSVRLNSFRYGHVTLPGRVRSPLFPGASNSKEISNIVFCKNVHYFLVFLYLPVIEDSGTVLLFTISTLATDGSS